ncbi:hypothetical protein [Photobacterium damselae]|uniref:hypothetical protein n=1 Tax=Photobacterium damselae TaxID=38293 RepID=UPI001F1D7C22|nr:hypothetical protein [Photobacterium damselae]UKA04584.1 hypothetical protein IHC89_23485 [Photobacterium damselae subsp. damselae]
MAAAIVPTMANADAYAVNKLKAEYKTAVKQHIGENHNVSLVTYLRSNNSVNDHYDGTDFVYLWHGSEQDTYGFMNVVGLLDDPSENKTPMFFSGVDVDDFGWETEENASNLLFEKTKSFKTALGENRDLALGYDLGVAPAFKAACENGVENIAIASGGLYESEGCVPSDMHAVYAVSSSDSLFPIDKNVSFESKKGAYSTVGRLDGKETIKRLVRLMDCQSEGVQTSNEQFVSQEFQCGHGNELTVVTYESSDHQWYGYKYATDGALNQKGSPSNKPMVDWIDSILNLN